MVFLWFFLLFSTCLCGDFNSSSDYIHLYGIPVGQGDGALIVCPGTGRTILMDLGSSREGNQDQILKFLRPYFPLTYVMVSHPDSDHWNLIQSLGILRGSEEVYLGGVPSDYPSSFINSIGAGKAHWFPQNYWGESLSFSLPNCGDSSVKISVLSANQGSANNQKSLVVRISYGSFSVLYTGDFEGKTQEDGLISHHCPSAGNCPLHVDLLKVAHHGASAIANTARILGAIKPKYAYVSSAYPPGAYGHPRCEVISRLEPYLEDSNSHSIPCFDSESQSVKVLSSKLFFYPTSAAYSSKGDTVTQDLLHFHSTTSSSSFNLYISEWTTPAAINHAPPSKLFSDVGDDE